MYARLMCETGQTWEYIGENMTLPRLYAFGRYWQKKYEVSGGTQQTQSKAKNDEAIAGMLASVAEESPHTLRDIHRLRVGR